MHARLSFVLDLPKGTSKLFLRFQSSPEMFDECTCKLVLSQSKLTFSFIESFFYTIHAVKATIKALFFWCNSIARVAVFSLMHVEFVGFGKVKFCIHPY